HEFYNHFFFQAEDGIRDFHVTGVQTCALPISRSPGMASETMPTRVPARYPGSQASSSTRIRILLVFPSGTTSSWVRWKGSMSVRSEERRVGKGGRAPRGRCGNEDKHYCGDRAV